MKKIFFALFVLLSVLQNSFSQCTEATQPKVLLVGDSWAFFMSVDQTINNVFRKWGHSNYTYVTNTVVSENGAETDDFLRQDKQDEIIRLLNENPSIEVVHLSIGGNDVLGDWKVSFTQQQTDSLKLAVEARLIQILDFIKSVKPGIRILWSGYVYPNFGEVIETSPLQNNHPFYGTWEGMEFPTFIQLNTILNDFSADVEAYTAIDPQVDFINCTGLMQYTFGQNTPLGVAPGGTYAPGTVSLPAGDPNYPSPANSMRDYFLTKDCFHLSARGYEDLIGYHTQKFYHKFLMDDLYLLSENSQTGSVSSSGNVSDSLFIGNENGEQFATILSFNTTQMADTTASKASIFLRRENLTGTNPLGNNLQVQIKSGNFGTTAAIEATDFTDTGNAAGIPCLFGDNSNGNWIRLDLPDEVLPYINNSTSTQFIISAPSATNGKVVFTNSANPDFAPVLNLVYGELPVSNVKDFAKKSFKIYPNPTNSLVTIEAAENLNIKKVEVVNLLGNVIQTKNSDVQQLNISSLPNGTYILNVYSETGERFSERLLKY